MIDRPSPQMKKQPTTLPNFDVFDRSTNPLKLRTNSVSSTSAQSSGLCELDNRSEAGHSFLATSFNLLLDQSQDLFCIAHLQFIHGLRISEVLSIQHHDISPQLFVKIRSKKGSSGRIIHAGEAAGYLNACRLNCVHPFSHYDRYFIYRQYKKAGISQYFGDNSKSSVTHFFRHNASMEAQKVNADLETRAHQLGHKSTKSTQHYGK